MSKEKIKKVIVNNQKKLLISLIIILIVSLAAIGMSVLADTNSNYVLDVKDDGSSNVSTDTLTSITKKIVDQDARSLTIETNVNNLQEKSNNAEVAIVIDASNSMSVNDNEKQAIQEAQKLVNQLLTNAPQTKVSISIGSGVKTALSVVNNSMAATIQAITYTGTESIGDAINNGLTTFSTDSDVDRYLVLFSDATDSAKNELKTAVDGGINVYSLLTGITNNEYATANGALGEVSMLEDIIDYSFLYNRINDAILNVNITDTFSEVIKEYFDFSVVSNDNGVTVENDENGYTMSCDTILGKESKKVTYKLTLKSGKSISSKITYNDLFTNDATHKMTLKYKVYENANIIDKTYEMERSPIFVICNKYSLTVKAVSEKSSELPVTGLDFKVVGKMVTGQDETGKDIYDIIFDDILTTDQKGNIKIDNLFKLGDVIFDIDPRVNQFGYSDTTGTKVIVHNDPTGVGTIWAESDEIIPNVDVVERNIEMIIPISVQSYTMKLKLTDKNDERIELGGVEFRLIQPKLNSKYDMEALYAKTDLDGNIVFSPSVMTKAGKYEYILTQMDEYPDYESMGNVCIVVEFDDKGRVLSAEKKYNQDVKAEKVDDLTVGIKVGNLGLNSDPFTLDIILRDKIKTDIPVSGAIYNFKVTRYTSNGTLVTTAYNNYRTDNNGKIHVDLPGNGMVKIEIQENTPKAGYARDREIKEIVFNRANGIINAILTDTNGIASIGGDNNTLVVKLYSLTANEKNRIQVKLLDEFDQTEAIQNTLISVTKIGETNSSIAITEKETGVANILLPEEEDGTYQYIISLASGAPEGYVTPSLELGTISVQFKNGHVVNASKISSMVESNVSFAKMIEDDGKSIFDTAKADFILEPDPTYGYKLKINLLNTESVKKNDPKGVAGAKYTVRIVSDGEEIKYLANRTTDENGNYITRLTAGGDYVVVEITETDTVTGYKKTTKTQTIELEKTDTGYQISQSTPYVYDPANGQYRGTVLENSTIIYHDVNDGISDADTIMNLYVNKMDLNGFLVPGVRVRFESDTLEIINPNDPDSIIPFYETFVTDQNGYFEKLNIRVKGDKLNKGEADGNLKVGERRDVLYAYELDPYGNKIPSSKIEFNFTFRKNNETGIIEITNINASWGNRLFKGYSFDTVVTSSGYENNIRLDIYTNFDDVGNFSIDLKKVDKDGNTLPGAQYDVVLTRPNGTTLIRRDIDVTDSVELPGVLVSEGTTIEITEKKAPIGYELNERTETIKIERVNEITGIVDCKLEAAAYSVPRAKLINVNPIPMDNGTYKVESTLELTDYELSTFKFGIHTVDSTTNENVANYKFALSTDRGASANTEDTDSNGKVTTKVGANYKTDNFIVKYEVDSIKAATYYKKLANPITVYVVFDMNGNVKGYETQLANEGNFGGLQPAEGYGTVWMIEGTNIAKGNDINIRILVDPCDPLVVNIQTVDTVTNSELTNIEYKIEPSINLSATGTTQINVGYVTPNGTQVYKIKETNADSIENYEPINEQEISVSYDANGNVIVDSIQALTDNVHIVSPISTDPLGKTITIKIDAEPSVPFVITNTGYYDGKDLANAQFEISANNVRTKKLTTDTNGEAVDYTGKFEKNSSVIYTIKQTKAAYSYAKVEDIQIEVFFDENRNITEAKLLGNVNKYITFVTVSNKTPSVNGDKGYNGNANGLINIEIKNYPAVNFEIENVDNRNESIKLQGTTYKLTSTINTDSEEFITNEYGIGNGFVDKSGYVQTVTYTIHEVNPASRYQTLNIDIQVEVDFDQYGYIINEPRVIKRSDVATASIPTVYNSDEDHFKILLKIKSNPELKINLTKVDSDDATIGLDKVGFDIVGRIVKSKLSDYTDDEIENGLKYKNTPYTSEEAYGEVMDRLKLDPEEVAKTKEKIAMEKITNDLFNSGKISEDNKNEILTQSSNSQMKNKLVEIANVTRTQINGEVEKVKNQETLDWVINKGENFLLPDGTSVVITRAMVDEQFTKVNDQILIDKDSITTDSNGQAISYINKTLANKTIEYTIKETRKAIGYDWLDEMVVIEVTYDGTGKMVTDNPVKLVSGNISIDNIDQDNFQIDVTIGNKLSDELIIHLTVEDVYDSNKKLETAGFDAFLTDEFYMPDNKYRTQLESGSTMFGGAVSLSTAHGEDTESLGIYESGDRERILRLVETEAPTAYFIGSEMTKTRYESIGYALLIDLKFNDEGSVIDAKVHNPGKDSILIGYIADNRYITVSHTRNTVHVTIKYYPMLQVKLQAEDMYTGQSLKGNFVIDTSLWGINQYGEDLVSAGYVAAGRGRTYNASFTTSEKTNSVKDAERVPVTAIEAENISMNSAFAESHYINEEQERLLYIYETAEPSEPIQYQRYISKSPTTPSSYYIGTIRVKYDNQGHVIETQVMNESSSNNIKKDFITSVVADENKHTIEVVVKYAPITKIKATIIDEVSGAPLSGVRISPYIDEPKNEYYDYKIAHRYEDIAEKTYETNDNGEAKWTYWSAIDANSQTRYVLSTSTTGSAAGAYYNPGLVILDISFGSDGRITAVDSVGKDRFGDGNVVEAKWDETTAEIVIKFARIFKVNLNKVDYYDTNIRLKAQYTITSNEGLMLEEQNSNEKIYLGKIYAGKAVKYTLSETLVPNGYIPINNMDILVQFNPDGSIRSATSTSDYYQLISVAEADIERKDPNKTDLVAFVKNKPRFDVVIDLSDMFYSELKLENATFSIENNKGDIASGGLTTDENGMLQTYVGPTYPGQTVEYTVRQTSTVQGYYQNNIAMKFTVLFNENGKIENYWIGSNSSSVLTMDTVTHIGGRNVKLFITNMPKDVKLGIYKFDKTVKTEMSDIEFTIKTMESGKVDISTSTTTKADGTALDTVDQFISQDGYGLRKVKYLISEVQQPDSYRKIQDIEMEITYNENGTIFTYDIIKNPSNVNIDVATNEILRLEDGTPIHIKLSVPNDNAYDLIVKNEDIDCPGLAIEGTVYDVSIVNGVNYTEHEIITDKDGLASIVDRQDSGIITISIAEKNVGEGYRNDNENNTIIELDKGTDIYSISLNNNSNPTKATVTIDEDLGTITVVFKNESKLELTLNKEDINSDIPLMGAEFEVKSEEIDQYGSVVTGTETVYTTTENNVTNDKGKIYLDLGKTYYNKTIKYTFTEITAPADYDVILPIHLTVKFDQYGRIISTSNDSFRMTDVLATGTGKSHHIITYIGNGTVNQRYTIKVVSKDSINNNVKIDGSRFKVDVIETATGMVNVTKSGITETAKEGKYAHQPGLLIVNGANAEGNVEIKLSQTGTAIGYAYGNNVTAGTIVINAQFTVVDYTTEKQVDLQLVDDAGFNVDIDNVHRTITIEVLNDPQLIFEITKMDKITGERMEGAKFNIQSVLVENGLPVDTKLNEKAKETNQYGITEAEAGMTYAGRKVIYTISEEKMAGYDKLQDIILHVQYDMNGNIKDAKIATNKNAITEVYSKFDRKDGTIKYKSGSTKKDKISPYAAAELKATGVGTKRLAFEIVNYPELKDYQIQIEKHHQDSEYPNLIPGATYEITVKQENGFAQTTLVDVTDENGIIKTPFFDGYGNIEITIQEKEPAPTGFKIDPIPKVTKLIRDKEAHKTIILSSDAGATTNADNSLIKLITYDEPITNSIIINKVNENGSLITNNPAEIMLEKINVVETTTSNLVEDADGNKIVEITTEKTEVREPIVDAKTNAQGRIIIDSIPSPDAPGEYRYVLTEKTAPKDFDKIAEDEVEIGIKFDYNDDNEMIIKEVSVKGSIPDVKATRISEHLINILVYNTDISDSEKVGENEYGISIRKVDTDLVQISGDYAEFELKDGSTGKVQKVQTDKLGRATMVRFNLPTDIGKYRYTLKETKAPDGYLKNENEMEFIVEFKRDSEGKIYLSNVESKNSKLVHANAPAEGELPDRKIILQAIDEDLGYNVIIDKRHVLDPYYPEGIAGVEFKIRVSEEFGQTTEWYNATTNEDGIINAGLYHGYGRIKVEIEELSAPSQFKQFQGIKYIEFNRDKVSKDLKEYDSNVQFKFEEDYAKVYDKDGNEIPNPTIQVKTEQRIKLIPTNELKSGLFAFVVNKVDKDTKKYITNNPAIFRLSMIEEYRHTVDVVDPDTGDVTQTEEISKLKKVIFDDVPTDKLGIIIQDTLVMPTEGTYTYVLEEVDSPLYYEGISKPIVFTVKYEKNALDDMIVSEVKVIENSNEVELLAIKDQLISMVVYNKNIMKEGQYLIDITKVDKDKNPILTDTAVFKLTDKQTNEVTYVETENAIAKMLINKPDIAGEYEYTLNEIKAPEDYKLNRDDITVKVTFSEDANGVIVISKVKVDGKQVIYDEVPEGKQPAQDKLSIKVINEDAEPNGDANEKRYNVIVNKIDASTGKKIVEHTTFDVALANGEIIHASTNEKGQLIIENIHMPSKEGTFELLIEETGAPEGYELDSEIKIVNATFTGIGQEMKITDVQLGTTNNKNVQVVKFTDDSIELNILNDLGLYVVSKKNTSGEVIYDVEKSFSGSQYSIDKPFIDTKVPVAGNNMSVQEFINNLDSNGILTIWDTNGIQINDTDRVKTGMILKANKGNQELTFTIVVKGDADGDGRVRAKDSELLIKHLSDQSITDPIKLRALDMNNGADGKIRANDKSTFDNVLAI